jgi:ABC-type transport system substrate-binding protein
VYFHDGERLTPQIAAEVLRLNVANGEQDGSSFASVTSISPSGDDTVEIRLSQPTRSFSRICPAGSS